MDCVGETEQIKDTFHNQFVSLKKVEQQSCKVSIYQSQYAGSCSHIKEWTGFEDDTFCEACTTRHALQTRNCYKVHICELQTDIRPVSLWYGIQIQHSLIILPLK